MIKGILKKNEPMAEHTSWRVGGPADEYFIPDDVNDLACYLRDLPGEQNIFWCGLGSNTLVRDKGIRGSVIGTLQGLTAITQLNDLVIRAEAGVSCATLARYTARQSLSGIEFLAGVPGTVGGALAMNAGCHGGETWPHVIAVEMMNRKGEVITVPASQFAWGYRHVVIPEQHWFIATHFNLVRGDKEKSLELIRELLARRTATQPTNLPSGGSTFQNPLGDYAARLIEASGLKGYQIGGAMVSDKHANFIVNIGNCKAQDIESLIYHMQKTVKEKFGIELVPEVRIVGEA